MKLISALKSRCGSDDARLLLGDGVGCDLRAWGNRAGRACTAVQGGVHLGSRLHQRWRGLVQLRDGGGGSSGYVMMVINQQSLDDDKNGVQFFIG